MNPRSRCSTKVVRRVCRNPLFCVFVSYLPNRLATPVVYVDAKKCIDCIKQNRETLLQKCMN